MLKFDARDAFASPAVSFPALFLNEPLLFATGQGKLSGLVVDSAHHVPTRRDRDAGHLPSGVRVCAHFSLVDVVEILGLGQERRALPCSRVETV